SFLETIPIGVRSDFVRRRMPLVPQVDRPRQTARLAAPPDLRQCPRTRHHAGPRTAAGSRPAFARDALAHLAWPAHLPRLQGVPLDGLAFAAALALGPVSLPSRDGFPGAAGLSLGGAQSLPPGA